MSQPQETERDLVESFVQSLEQILGWGEAEIAQEFPVQVGHETKRGDIMLADVVVVEAKRQGIDFADAHILQQLKSYMRVKYKKFGFLLGSELWLFYDDYADTHEDLKFIGGFRFDDMENAAAGELMETLAKTAFSIDKLTNFCNEHWSGKYMESLVALATSVRKSVMGVRKEAQPRLSSEAWRQYWSDFQRQYQVQDGDGILARMELGSHNDLYVREKVVKELFGQKCGIQFGLVKGNRPGMRKVEVRISKEKVFQGYFAQNLPKIVGRIEGLGGTYASGNPEKVINCYFPVADDTAASYERVFEVYNGFKEIILDYYLGRK